jgi:hypothetical protein
MKKVTFCFEEEMTSTLKDDELLLPSDYPIVLPVRRSSDSNSDSDSLNDELSSITKALPKIPISVRKTSLNCLILVQPIVPVRSSSF